MRKTDNRSNLITTTAMRTALARSCVLMAFLAITIAALAGRSDAQTTAFTYQGRLVDNLVAANGSYSMKFRLYNAVTAGTQIGAEIPLTVTATNGIFNVSLDFGSSSFPSGALRWLEIQVGTTTLTPRQQLSGSPFSIRSLAANQSDLLSSVCNPCVTDAQISGISGSKVSGSVANADNAVTASNSLNLGGVAASNYLLKSGGTVTGSLTVGGVISGNGSGLTNLPNTGFSWLAPGGTAIQAVSNKGYLVNDPALATVTLPASPAIGDTVRVSSSGLGGFKIAQNAGQSILQLRNYNPDAIAWPLVRGVYSSMTYKAVATSADGLRITVVAKAPVPLGCSVGVPCPAEGVFNSSDGGVTWVGSDLGGTNRDWVAVASSSDGTKLVGAVSGGQILTSADSGVTWTARDSARFWTDVASSADGTKLVAAVSGGQIYTSSNSGVTWTARAQTGTWLSVTSSADGTRLAAADYNGLKLWISTDSGVTWVVGTIFNSWTSISMSSDGSKLVASADGLSSNSGIWISSNFGSTWTKVNPLTARAYSSVRLSGDGTRYLLAASGNNWLGIGDFGVAPSQIPNSLAFAGAAISNDGSKRVAVISSGIYIPAYRSPLNTTVGTAGALIGADISAVELQYVGNNEFIRLSSTGTITVQ